MSGEHYALLGLARPRAGWFDEVGRWATSAALPAEFVRCVSVEELRGRLAGGRAWSAVLLDHGVAGLDRDLLDEARAAGCAPVVVADGTRRRDWEELGAAAVLDQPLHRDALLAVLRSCAAPLERLPITGADLAAPVAAGAWRGRLVAVAGAGGTGTSTVAAALAQGLAADPAFGGRVVLVDAALDACQALLHDTGDVVPGLQELVEAHRLGGLDAAGVHALTWHCPDHGYDVVLGLRRHRDWTVLRPRSVEAAVGSLRRAYAVTVADVDADVEGEAATGSFDVEDRNVLARHLTATADAVLVTAAPTALGLHRLVRNLLELLEHGVAPEALLPVVNRAPRHARQRAELSTAIAALLRADGRELPAGPLFLPARRELDSLQRDAAPLPRPFADRVAAATGAVLEAAAGRHAEGAADGPVPVRPGKLGGLGR